MSGVFRAIGSVAGVVASVAVFIPGGQAIAGIAAAVATVAGGASQLLAKPPAQKGAVNQRIIGANNPLPYLMGRSYSAGVQVHDVGYGGEVNDVDNPYRWLVTVHSAAGPVDAIENTLANYAAVTFSSGEATGYYADYWWRDTQLGARPEADALTPNFSGAPRWGTSYKLSGFCAVGHNFKWSKRGKRFGGGQLPIVGEIVRGVKVYDPRLDSTFPGGSGSQRITDESTWAYSANPALHALAYAYGRYVNGKKVIGVDLGSASIDRASVVAWANVCEANGWTLGGTIYEGAGQSKWDNLKRICQAGGAQPVLAGGILRFDFQSPRTSLATITRDDLAAGPIRDSLGRGWKDRHNTIVPRYRSEAHQWEIVQAAPIAVSAFVTEDGESKVDEVEFGLVTDKDQAAELATYEIWQRREIGPITLPLKAHFRGYTPGDCFTLAAELSPTGAALKVVLRRRAIDVASGAVNCTFEAESDAKHTAALGSTATAPSTISFPTPEELDDTWALNSQGSGELGALITSRAMVDADPSDGLLQATATSITIETHTAQYFDRSVSVTGATLTTEDDGTTAIAAETRYFIYYDDALRAGGAVAFKATQLLTDALNSDTNPGRHFVGAITTDVTGGSGVSGGGQPPPYVPPGDWDEIP